MGVMHPLAAVDVARQKGLDLVEVAPNANPPVCRLMDYGKYRYEQSKRERESRRTQKNITLKEIRLGAKTDDHDLRTKGNRAKKFLQAGDKVKLTVRFKGREVTHPEIGQEVISRIVEVVGDDAVVEQVARMEGRNMTSVLAPRKEKAPARKQSGENTKSPDREEAETHA